jgi:serine kinase
VCKIVTEGNATKCPSEKFHQREIHILTEIENPNIIHVHGRGPEIFIFMSFAEMGYLLDFIRKNGKVPEQQARIWFRQMASGLQYLHGKNYVLCFNFRFASFVLVALCSVKPVVVP